MQSLWWIFHARFFADDIAADRSKSAARIFDEGTNDHICADLSPLFFFHKSALAVIYHADYIRFDIFDIGDQLTDSCYG